MTGKTKDAIAQCCRHLATVIGTFIYRETQMIALCDESLADMDPAADQ